MPFIQVDPSKLQMDAPSMGGNAPQGFVSVDPSKIQMDAPQHPSVMGNIIGQPAQLAANAVATAGQAGDIAKTALTNIGQTESTPLDTSNPIATIGDLGGRAASIAGNMVRTVTSPAEAVLRNNVFQPGGMISRNVLPMIVNKQFEGSNIPQAQLDQLAQDPRLQKTFQDVGANALTQSTLMAATTPRDMNLADSIKPFGEPSQVIEAPPGGGGGTPPQQAPLTPDMLNTAVPNAYKAVKDQGANISPQAPGRIENLIDSAKETPGTARGLTTKQISINNTLDDLKQALPTPGGNWDLEGYQKLDTLAGQEKVAAWKSGDQNAGRILQDVQSKIRQTMQPDNLQPGDVIGSPEGIDTLQNHAIPMAAVRYKVQDLMQAIQVANDKQVPASAIMRVMANLKNSPEFKSYPSAVQDMVTKASQTGIVDDTMGILGSRLNAVIGGAVGGVHGAVAGNIVSSAFRTLRNNAKNNQVDAIVSQMLEGVRPSIEKFANYTSPPPAAPLPVTPPNMGAMTPAQARTIPMPKP